MQEVLYLEDSVEFFERLRKQLNTGWKIIYIHKSPSPLGITAFILERII